jgi:hypothetical protein
MEQCIFKYLRCEPEDHYFLLTEPPLNTPGFKRIQDRYVHVKSKISWHVLIKKERTNLLARIVIFFDLKIVFFLT